MSAHTVTFIAAAALNLIASILLELKKKDYSDETDARLEIAVSTMDIIILVVLSIS